MKNNFEQLIKNSLESHQVPYEDGAWEKFYKAQATTPFYKSKWIVGAVVLIAIITSITLYNVKFNSAKAQVETIDTKVKKVVSKTPNQLILRPEEKKIITKKVKAQSVTKATVSKSSLAANITEPKEKNIKANNEITITSEEEVKFETKVTLEKTKETNTLKSLQAESEEKKSTISNVAPLASFFIEELICEGNEVNLFAENPTDAYDYSWKINDQELAFGKTITLKANKIGQNTATLFIKQNGKLLAKKENSFIVLKSPNSNISIDLNKTSLINEIEFEMEDMSQQVSWNFGDGTTSTERNPTHTYKKAGKYNCEYIVTKENGCSTKFERNINVVGYYNLRTNYGFSPGKIDDINDNFIPAELKELNVPFELSIYARNGQLLYTTISQGKPWNGRMKDGSTCPFGSYVWVVSLTNELGDKEVYKGTVTNVNN